MYIEPNTNIKILKNVPLYPNYINTLFFTDVASQTSYFNSKVKYNLTNYSYQRVNKGVARVGIKTELLYDCNYMMFQNTAFGNKWFYAFITKLNYINDVTCEIEFEIDVMQTWLRDYTMNYCFVERQHTFRDEIGDNIIPENFSAGEYVFNDYQAFDDMTDMCVIIAILDIEDGADGEVYDGVYGCATLWAYNMNQAGVQSINNKINEYTQKIDSILSMYMCPKFLIPNATDEGIRLSFGASGIKRRIELPNVKTTDRIDGYLPKNHKLYTFPYNFINIDNASGSDLTLKYEYFYKLLNTGEKELKNPTVEITGTITQPVKLIIRPTGYKGSPSSESLEGRETNNTEGIELSDYPLCSFGVDSWQAWIAQNAVPTVLNTVAKGVGIGTLAYAMYNTRPMSNLGQARAENKFVKAGVGTGISGALNLMSDLYTAKIQPDISRGSIANGNVNVASNKQKFYYGRMSVNSQTAKIIDDYFNMYGYAIKEVTNPQRNTRPHWTYLKTVGCTINGSIPSDDEEKICSIYDNGITFWKNGDEVGNYTLDNSPIV